MRPGLCRLRVRPDTTETDMMASNLHNPFASDILRAQPSIRIQLDRSSQAWL